jgi:nitrate/TMAO reductase-like tetraheme cytochrome c subunit
MKLWVKRTLKTALVGGILVVVLFFASVWYTNRSDFCTTCHYMQPFYDAWASSSHGEVPCRECHYEPGYSNVVKGKFRDLNQLVKYWTKAYQRSKPWAEVADASCLRSGCHETRLLKGRVSFGKVNFDHRPHLAKMRRGQKLRCTSCHSQIVQGEHMTVTETTCILCHFKLDEDGNNLARCTICHEPPTASPGEEEPPKYDHAHVVEDQIDCLKCHGQMVVGDGAVPRERCYACHWERERLDQFHNTDLMHDKHITESKIECDRCHLSMQHKSIHKEQAMPECQTCHTDFHTLQQDLFIGHGGKGVVDRPNPMHAKGLSCQSCHILHRGKAEGTLNGETFVASGASCEPCHGSGYNRLLDNWQKSINRKMKLIGTALAEGKKVLARTAENKTFAARADSLLGDVRHNYDMVRLGKPIHNIVYANDLLEVAGGRLRAFFALADPGHEVDLPDHNGKVVPSACVNCHVGIEDIEALVFGLTYSHERHLVKANLDCTQCHSNQRRHGELVVQRQDCLSCHHSQTERECGYCHAVQYATISADPQFLPLEEPDIMFAADVGCRECHEFPDRTITKPVPQRCADCHDNEYAELQREWLDEFAALRQSVEDRLSHIETILTGSTDGAILDRVRRHLASITADGSRGSHNHFELMRILEEDLAALDRLLDEGR